MGTKVTIALFFRWKQRTNEKHRYWSQLSKQLIKFNLAVLDSYTDPFYVSCYFQNMHFTINLVMTLIMKEDLIDGLIRTF